MMKGMMSVLHPAFDALSAYADLNDGEGARSRIGEHVARCGQCAEVVREIRELGEASRAMVVDAAPSELWSRIARAAADQPLALPVHDEPTRTWPMPERSTVRGIVATSMVAFAAVLVGMFVLQRTTPLYAGGPGRFTISPMRPAPGTRVHVRYQPPPKLAALDQVILVGQYVSDPAQPRPDFYFGGDYDSLAVLRKTADGSMVGDFAVPSNFAAVSLVVTEGNGPLFDADGMYSWLVVGGDRQGRPALRSLLAALSLSGLYGNRRRAAVLDTLQRYFPDHPAGFATAEHYRAEGVFANLIKYFESAQRKYSSFDTRLSKQKTLDADRIAAMIAFAWRIQEPGEAAKWTMRMVREHPDDPRALASYAEMLHEKELRLLPKDSIVPFIPMLDSLYDRSRVVTLFSNAPILVQRYGDDAAKRRWALHALDQFASHPSLGGLPIDKRWLSEASIRAKAEASLRAAAKLPCVQVHYGRLWSSAGAENRYCLNYRSNTFSDLSGIALMDGRLSEATTFSDSAIALAERAGNCVATPAHRAKGEVLFAKGDTMGAARMFSNAYTYANWQSLDARREIAQRMGPGVSAGQWAALDSAAAEDLRTCIRRGSVRDSLDRAESKLRR